MDSRSVTGRPPGTAPLTVSLMLESDGPGGAEQVLLNLAGQLLARGHRVVPVGPAIGTGRLAAEFRSIGLQPETFSLRAPIDWRCARDLARTLSRRKVDVVHSHEFTMAVYGTAAARLAGIPHVITFHGNERMTRALRRRVACRLAIRGSAGSVAVSASTRNQLVADLGRSALRLRVILNGVPSRVGNRAAVRRELGMRDDEVLVLAVGNLDPRKGHVLLLEALTRLRGEGDGGAPWRLGIAAGRGGPERERLEQLAARQGVTDRLHLLSFRDDVPDLLAAADIFVMPSLWEGLPLALLEAMHAGKPVVASRVAGIPEAVRHGEDGLLVPPGDVTALTAALRTVLVDRELRRRLAEGALARARREFTVERMTDDYEDLYRSVLKPRPAGSEER